MVMSRSLRFSMLRVAIMAGTAQATPLIKGITDLPFRPTCRMSRSVKKLIRAIYPVSSNMVMSPNNIMICGMNTAMPLMPATMPLMRMSLSLFSGNSSESQPLNEPKPASIQSIG